MRLPVKMAMLAAAVMLHWLAADVAARAGEEPAAGEAPAPEVVKIGQVTWHRKERRIEIDGFFCLDQGPMEYMAVLKGGKEYESVLAFDCRAVDLNLAMIGAEYKAEGGVRRIGDPETPKGDPVYLHLEWQDDTGKKVRAEDLLWNQVTKKPMKHTAWVFSGSMFMQDPDSKKLFFLAEEERKLIAVYRDPAALFNNPLDTGADDVFYIINKDMIPKPALYRCPRHDEVVAKEPGRCPKCELPLSGISRPVKLSIEPAPKDSLNPENLKDGAELHKATGEENPPDYRPPPGTGGEGETKAVRKE
jgi:hypothetical protein